MTVTLPPRFRLYTVDEVAKLFTPNADKVDRSIRATLLEVLESYGGYRLLGDTKYLTEDDIGQLYRNISVRVGTEGAPAASTDGHILIIGHPVDVETAVAIVWCQVGRIEETARQFEFASSEPGAKMLESYPATRGAFLEIRETLKPHVHHGYWLHRTKAVQNAMTELANRGV
jgi:hypothetical protein